MTELQTAARSWTGDSVTCSQSQYRPAHVALPVNQTRNLRWAGDSVTPSLRHSVTCSQNHDRPISAELSK